MEHTDTERLDWVLNHSPDRDFTWQTGDYWIVWWDEERKVVHGKSWRDCIDKVLDSQ